MKRWLIVLILQMCCTVAFAQNPEEQTIDGIIENIIDYMDDREEQIADADLLYEDLKDFYENKINLNSVDKQTLEKLQFLSDIQIENILAYVYINKGMQTIYELQLIDGINYFATQFLLPFVTVEPIETASNSWNFKHIFRRTRHELYSRVEGGLEKKRGYSEKIYLGSPVYQQVRYSFRAKDRILAGFAAEKDAGEQFWGNKNKGFDSYSAYIQLNKLWKFSKIIIGDYRATFAQGLIMNGGFRTGKSSYVMTVMPSNRGITRKASTDEYNFFRGVAAELSLRKVTVTALYSIRQYDSDTSGGSFSTIRQDGLFRRDTDWEKRKNLTMQVAAINLNYRHENFKLGSTLYYGLFSVPAASAQDPYKLFAFKGRWQTAASLDYYYKLHKFTFFGETSITDRGAVATLNSVMIAPVSTLNIVALHRYFSKKYDIMFAKTFSKSSQLGNENGVYLGVEILPAKRWKISSYSDVFSFSWAKFRAVAPSKGFDLLLQTDYMHSRNLSMYLRGKYASAEENYNLFSQPSLQIQPYKKASFRYNLEFKAQNLSFRSIVEANIAKEYGAEANYGFALVQDMAYNTIWKNSSIALHYVFFDAKNFNNRFYFYERDLPYSMYIPSLYGQGNRYTILIKSEIVRDLSLYLRFAQTIYSDNRKTIGSGYETIDGSLKTDFKIGIKWNFRVYNRK